MSDAVDQAIAGLVAAIFAKLEPEINAVLDAVHRDTEIPLLSDGTLAPEYREAFILAFAETMRELLEVAIILPPDPSQPVN